MSRQLIVRNRAQNEDLIRLYMVSWKDAAIALRDIRELKQYEPEFNSFDDYCKTVWNWSRSYASRLIEAAGVVENLLPIGNKKSDETCGKQQNIIPENESQARAIAEATDDPEEQRRIWTAAVEDAPVDSAGNPKVTAAAVKKKASELLGEQPPEEKPIPAEPENIADAFGPVADKLVPVFEEVSTFKGLQKKLGAFQNELEDLQRSDAGAAIPIQDMLNHLRELKHALKFSIPYCECPKCRRSKKNCDACEGIRWITEATYKRCRTEEDEQWLKGDRS